MASAREIRRRIQSVKNISKVTGALEAVSASKVRKAQAQVMATRYYAGAALHILRDLALRHDGSAAHPLLDEHRSVKNVGVVLITSDRGLAGPYNSNVVRTAMDFEAEKGLPIQYIPVGRKGRDILLRRGATIVAEFSGIPDSPGILDITAITRTAVDDFLSGDVDEVYIIFTDFINTLRQEPRVRRLLPLKPTEGDMTGLTDQVHIGMDAVYTFEPDAQTILDEILPRFTELQLYQALLESLASEHSARMVAMRNATENAEALVEDLTLVYNKARQLAITSEMLDIVGGAEALAQSE
jgi:F-type H+-transporting ATPase subunit gamma